MSFKTRMEQLDADIINLETATPFILNQVFPPNQKDWETAWLAAGNALPIPTYQELYWHDDIGLRGEYKTLPDQFSMTAVSQSVGFQIRDIAGWLDDQVIVYVVRDDPDAPQGACLMYMDGTLEEITFASFNPDGLLGFDWMSDQLWYYEGLVVKRINYTSGTIVTVFTAVAGGLPEWRFFCFANYDGSAIGDCFFGAKIGADVDRCLYYYNISPSGILTNVMTTFDPGTGAVRPDRPLAFTQNYVFLSETKSRSAFDGNIVHQITRSGFTWQTKVDDGVSDGGEVRVIVSNSHYRDNYIDLIVGHVSASLNLDWNFTTRWTAATQTAVTTEGQPHHALLQAMRQNINDHNLDYHMDTRVYYDPSFVADGGNEAHFNNIGGMEINFREERYLLHDLGWHTWTTADAPNLFIIAAPESKLYDIYLHPDEYTEEDYPWLYGPPYYYPIDFTIDSYTESTRKIYRVTDWQQYDDDFIIVATGTLNGGLIGSQNPLSIADVSPEFGLIEVVFEIYGAVPGNVVYPALYDSAGGHGENILSSNVDALTADEMASTSYPLSELSTNASLIHQYIFRYPFETTQEITSILRHSVRTAFGTYVNRFQESVILKAVGALEISSFDINLDTTLNTNRYLIRAWRTQPRMKQSGSEYDPSMA